MVDVRFQGEAAMQIIYVAPSVQIKFFLSRAGRAPNSEIEQDPGISSTLRHGLHIRSCRRTICRISVAAAHDPKA